MPPYMGSIASTLANGSWQSSQSSQESSRDDSSNASATLQQDLAVPVLIVGAGPTGLLLAHLLSKLGVRSLVIEKYTERLLAPKAHAVNPRTLEICRQFGLDTKAIRRLGSPRKDAFWVNFVTNLNGERIGVLPYERMDVAVLDHTPEMIHNVPQPAFEQFIVDQLADDPLVEIRRGVGFASCSQKGNVVTTVVEEGGSKERYNISSEYMVACDGAKSAVRSYHGVEADGEDSYETMMTIHINADLRPVLGDRIGMLHWILDPAVSGFIIGYDLSGNQVLICNFNSKTHPVSSWDETHCRTVVTAAIGKDIPFKVLSYRPWILSRKVAKEYRCGNVLFCGDAAHAFPPTGGLGLNCGLADVHNLAWKLAATSKGWASQGLLDTYGLERRHIAEIYSKQSVKNGKKIFSFLKTLGVANIEDVDEARQNLLKSIHAPSNKEFIEAGVEGQREHFDNLELHIGYVYGGDYAPPNASHYTPKFAPGARLPHAWISPQADLSHFSLPAIDASYVSELTASELRMRRYSILDLCPIDSFTLIVARQDPWQAVYDRLSSRLSERGIKTSIFVAAQDFAFTTRAHKTLYDQDGNFADGGGLLVRPDQHILLTLSPSTGAEAIETAILGLLALPRST